MEKAVCYFLTRNIYKNVLPSLKSLMKNGNIDKVFMMIEDDEIGFWLPENVKTVNVSRWKEELDPAGPNYLCRWSYMVMMKVMLSRMFPRRKRILSLDVDTIVMDDISDMWKLDISDKYFAGAREWYWTRAYGRDCINAGVLLWNLEKMRDGMTDRVLEAMNTKKYNFVEQDALSEVCTGKFRIMDSVYNCTKWTDMPSGPPKIMHFAAYKEKFFEQQIVKQYMDMTWEEALK